MHPTNFRDVGEALALWLDVSPIPAGRLFRGGRIDTLSRPEDIGLAETIVNLRSGTDPSHLGAAVVHIPAPNDLENYETQARRVSRWIRQVLTALASDETRWPVYIHCTSGRDRTGVVVAAALLVMGVPRDIVIEEYLLSEGASRSLITQAIEGLASFEFEGTREGRALQQRLGRTCASATDSQ